jgi:hypothetical protein
MLTKTARHLAGQSGRANLINLVPYLVVLVFTIIGVAYTSVSKKPLVQYWEILAVVTAGVCILSGWPRTLTRDDRVRLIWTQLLHWAAFLAAMNLVLMSDVQQMLNADATGLAILLLLALGTFVAGVHSLSWQTCVLGILMALSVPAIAWIEESALILLLATIALIGVGGAFWWYAASSSGSASRPSAPSSCRRGARPSRGERA